MSRSDQPYKIPYEYECSAGHDIGSNHAMAACPMVVKGQPCNGTLERVNYRRKRKEPASTEV